MIFSILTIADRFTPSKVFFLSSLIAATANLALIWLAKDPLWLFVLRFVTGFFLAGIYPVGIKIAADCFPQKLGNALGFLVGALVLGTAFPQILKSRLHSFHWKDVLVFTSLLAILGGILILLFVPHYKKKQTTKFDLTAAFTIFRVPVFRSAAFGYFGHMWELYAFWAFVPFIITMFNRIQHAELSVPLWSFCIIAAGSIGCVAGGFISQRTGSRKVAFYSLLISGICCLCSPFLFGFSPGVFLMYMLVWGSTVVSDSPQFSTLVAQSAPAQNKGTALTIVTSIGFAITIASIQLLHPAMKNWNEYGLLILAIGPILGLIALANNEQRTRNFE